MHEPLIFVPATLYTLQRSVCLFAYFVLAYPQVSHLLELIRLSVGISYPAASNPGVTSNTAGLLVWYLERIN